MQQILHSDTDYDLCRKTSAVQRQEHDSVTLRNRTLSLLHTAYIYVCIADMPYLRYVDIPIHASDLIT